MDMRLKSQPSAVVNIIMYRPVASVKPYEFPLANHGFNDWQSRRPRCILAVFLPASRDRPFLLGRSSFEAVKADRSWRDN